MVNHCIILAIKFIKLLYTGRPPAPTELRASENGPGSLNISWFLEYIVPVNSTLTAMNLNASNAKRIVISEVRDQHYIFTVENSTSCDVYSFQVTAMAAGVGSSDPSAVLTRSIPSPPDISLVENSLEHFLAKTACGEFTLVVTIQVMFLAS